MGSQLVISGKIGNKDYRIYNIDNVYTVYIQIETEINPDTKVQELIFSAVKTFPTMKEAKDYVSSLTKK